MSEDCHEFTVGLCTKELFKYGTFTKTCKKHHNIEAREDYLSSNVLVGIEDEVLKTYTYIIKATQRKIKNNKGRIIRHPLYSKLSPLLQDSIEIKYFRLYNRIQSKTLYQTMCKVCGAFLEGKVCNHFMHGCYEELNKVAEELERKIKRSQ